MIEKLPTKIDHNHIIDSVVEIRFLPKNGNTVVPEILSAVKDHIPNYRFIGNEFPRALRQVDPQLQNGVELTLSGKDFSVGIGLNSVVFNCQNGYKTWKEFYPFIVLILSKIGNIVDNVVRIGVRFTNFFEGKDDLKHFNIAYTAGLPIVVDPNTQNVSQVVFKFSTVGERVSYNVTIANKTKVQGKPLQGVLVDVDAYAAKNIPSQINSELFDRIEEIHLMEKHMFFSLLEKTFLESLHPEY